MRLTRLGITSLTVAAVALLAGVAAGHVQLVTAAAALAGAVLVAALTVMEPPPADVGRRPSAPVIDRTDPATMTLAFRSAARRRPRPFNIVEQVAGELRVAGLPPIQPGGTASIEYALDTSRRGTIVCGPLLLRRTDPFGLVIADRRIGDTASVTVRPRRHALSMLPRGHLRDLEGPTREIAAGTATFHQLRDYVPGDDLRHIHWRSTARTGRLTVRQLVDTTKPELVVIVDSRASRVAAHDFEEVVEVAASVLHAADRAGFPARLEFTTGDPDSDAAAVPHIDRLTRIQASDSDGFDEIADAITARSHGLVFVGSVLDGADLHLLSKLARELDPAIVVSIMRDRTAPFVTPPGMTGFAASDAIGLVATWGSS
jgi:uncharacterized protein (DUF58 family)